MIQLRDGDDLAEAGLPIAVFGLDDDGQDEIGQLDLDQMMEFSIVESLHMAGQGVVWNRLWIDDVLFIK